MEQEVVKKYVHVVAAFSPEGKLLPLCVVWEDGRKFEIDRVKQCVRAASRKAGGVGFALYLHDSRQGGSSVL